MKKIIALLTAVLVSTAIQTKGFADELEDSFIDKAGITPTSILYPIDVAIDNIRIALAVGEENKINTIMDVAEERLGESQVLLDQGEEAKAGELINEYQEKMDVVAEKIESKINEITPVEQTTTETSIATGTTDTAVLTEVLNEIKEINDKVALRQEKALQLLNRIKEKENIPEEVKEKVQAVIQMQTLKAEAVSKFVEEKNKYIEVKKAYEQAKEALETAEESGDAEAIEVAKLALEQLEEEKDQAKESFKEALDAKKEAMEEAVEARKEAFKEIKEEYKKQEKAKKEEDKQRLEKKKEKKTNKEEKEEIKEQQEGQKEKAKAEKEQAKKDAKAKKEEMKKQKEQNKDNDDQDDQDNDDDDDDDVIETDQSTEQVDNN